jgi:hypothetical protein
MQAHCIGTLFLATLCAIAFHSCSSSAVVSQPGDELYRVMAGEPRTVDCGWQFARQDSYGGAFVDCDALFLIPVPDEPLLTDSCCRGFAELVEPHGYPLEQHFVTTNDGYVLRMFRIPSAARPSGTPTGAQLSKAARPARRHLRERGTAGHLRDSESVLPARQLRREARMWQAAATHNPHSTSHSVHGPGQPLEGHRRIGAEGLNPGARPVIYLQHALADSSADWVMQGPGNGLAFVLADAGKRPLKLHCRWHAGMHLPSRSCNLHVRALLRQACTALHHALVSPAATARRPPLHLSVPALLPITSRPPLQPLCLAPVGSLPAAAQRAQHAHVLPAAAAMPLSQRGNTHLKEGALLANMRPPNHASTPSVVTEHTAASQSRPRPARNITNAAAFVAVVLVCCSGCSQQLLHIGTHAAPK